MYCTLVGYAAQAAAIRLIILFNTQGTAEEKEKPRRAEKNGEERRTLTVLAQDYAAKDREHNVAV